MSLPTAEQNGVFSHIYPYTDLGLQVDYDPSEYDTGTQFSTGVPATLLVFCKLVSGAGTLKIETGASGFTPTYAGTYNTTLTLTGTSWCATVVDTEFVFDDSSSTTTTLSTDRRYVATKVTNTSGSDEMGIDEFGIIVCYELTAGEDWFQGIRSSANAVANRTVGDSYGNISWVPDYSDNPYINADLKL